MTAAVLLPDGEVAAGVRKRIPELRFATWTEAQSSPDLSPVQFYVPPYLGGPETIEILDRLSNLKVVQLLTAGVDWILPRIRPGVVVCRARGVHDASTAEIAVAGVLAMIKQIPRFVRQQLHAEWQHVRVGALPGKRAVVLGYGEIGRAVGERLAPFGVDVVGVTRSGDDGTVPVTQLRDVLPECDILVITLPLTARTAGLVDAATLALLPRGALVANVARGPIVDQDALRDELTSGRLCAVLDVTAVEPLPPADPLWRMDNVLITPHVGGDSELFPDLAARLVADQLRRYLAGQPLRYRISGSY
jgi:phosphoglycerate dehydrogenase-like enzyme